MAEVIRMPRLSDTMAEGKILSWNKKVGDKIKAGDVLAEVETDKATMELESYNEGTLLYIGVEAGNATKVDGVLAVVGKAGEDYKTALTAAGSDKDKDKAEEEKNISIQKNTQAANQQVTDKKKETVALPAGAKEIRMPLLSDTMTEGKIVSWHKKVGDKIKADDVLADVETDKATMEVVGYEEGTLLYIGIEAGKAAKINELIAIIGKAGTDISAYSAGEKSGADAEGSNSPEASATDKEKQNEQVVQQDEEMHPDNADIRIKASPLAKKLAEEKGIDLSKVNGSGDNGRVTKKDVDSYIPPAFNRQPLTESNSTRATSEDMVPAFPNTTQESYTDVPLTQMRSAIARRLGESMFSAPHFYLTMELNMDKAIIARTTMNEISPVKISFNDIMIKACAMALRLHPAVNSSWMGNFIRHNHHIHIGSAIALPEGLIVPVIKFADQKTLSQIAAEAKQMYQKAKEKKLQPVEFTGNTFTISNLGMMDIDEFTAIINPPDSCILAVGKIKETVVRKGTGFDVSHVMKVTLSCDHRSVDGAVGAAFLQTLKRFVHDPVMMLM